MCLSTYRKKRNFKSTPEPFGKSKRRTKQHIFVVQKHAAQRLHYDFRLELDGVLKSWAVPKGPSLNPSEKRLAVHVEDHPLDYASFEGTIPAGEYGGGTVLVWDRGTWTSTEPDDSLDRGKLTFRLKGEKLRGAWTLVRMKGQGNSKNWLLIKSRDEFADGSTDVTLESPRSVESGLTLEEFCDARKPSSEKSKNKASKVRSGPRR